MCEHARDKGSRGLSFREVAGKLAYNISVNQNLASQDHNSISNPIELKDKHHGDLRILPSARR